jgi:glycosyltransferase involved in cell wall biosynthesis
MPEVGNDLLGLCIPTFNRSKYLDVCLRSAIGEFANHGFPIYVSDNGSTDDTMNVVLNYARLYENLHYSRYETNLGAYANILKVMAMAETKYLWLMGDDDYLVRGGVQLLIKYLEKGYDYVVVNAAHLNEAPQGSSLARIIRCKHDKEYNKGEAAKLLVDLKYNWYHGFMSSMILRTSLLKDLLPKYKGKDFALKGTSWLPLAIFYEAIKEAKGVFVCQPVFINDGVARIPNNDIWTYLWGDYLRALAYLVSIGYPRRSINKIIMSERLASLLARAVLARSTNHKAGIFDADLKYSEFIPVTLKVILMLTDHTPRIINDRVASVLRRLGVK